MILSFRSDPRDRIHHILLSLHKAKSGIYYFIAYMDTPLSPCLLPLRNSLLDLVDLGVDGVVGSLLGDHDSESLEVGEVLLGLTGSELLGPSSVLPRLNNSGLVQDLLDDSGASTAADVDLEVSQGQPTDGHLLSLDT